MTGNFPTERRPFDDPTTLAADMDIDGISESSEAKHPQHSRQGSLFKRSWNAVADVISPFSSSALATLPKVPIERSDREVRTDNIPEVGSSSYAGVRDYNSVNPALPPNVPIPQKLPTPIRVEGKVWFANERTWVAYTNIGVLLGTLALALSSASKDSISLYFGYIYALLSCGVIVYGYVVYQRRVTMIRKRDPGSFDQLWGPVVISALLFVAVAANFLIRLGEFQKLRDQPNRP